MEEDCKDTLRLLLKPQRLPKQFSSIVMAVVYYPPGQTAANKTSMIDSCLTNVIDSILQSYPSDGIIIAGDLDKMKLRPLCNSFDLQKILKKPTSGKIFLTR